MQYDVIIIGGSYSGLAAAMSLGRSLRKVLVIDSGKPCNRQTPASHNFLTQDGEKPAVIAAVAKEQVLKYDTVRFEDGLVIAGSALDEGFAVTLEDGRTFSARKLILATGLRDVMPDIAGVAECWGISVIHCPYCHGYEVHGKPTGILANGDMAFEYCKLIRNWTSDLTLFTNGVSTLTAEQQAKLQERNIRIIETEIDHLEHTGGELQYIHLQDGSKHPLTALYHRAKAEQHSDIPAALGCAINEMGMITVDNMQRTNVKGVYACGDDSVMFRSVSMAVATGTMAGAVANKEMIDEDF